MLLLPFLSARDVELGHGGWCQNEVVGEHGGERARREICEGGAGPSPLVALRNFAPNSMPSGLTPSDPAITVESCPCWI